MSLQVLVSHSGERIAADGAAFDSLDHFRSWLAKATTVPAARQILLTTRSKHVRAQTLTSEVSREHTTMFVCLQEKDSIFIYLQEKRQHIRLPARKKDIFICLQEKRQHIRLPTEKRQHIHLSTRKKTRYPFAYKKKDNIFVSTRNQRQTANRESLHRNKYSYTTANSSSQHLQIAARMHQQAHDQRYPLRNPTSLRRSQNPSQTRQTTSRHGNASSSPASTGPSPSSNAVEA